MNPAPYIAKYGVTKSLLHHIMTTKPVIAQSVVPALEDYHLLFWSGTYLKNSVVNGVIRTDGGTDYHVVFRGITPELAYRSSQLFLSFRKPQPEYNLPAYVIICAVHTRKFQANKRTVTVIPTKSGY